MDEKTETGDSRENVSGRKWKRKEKKMYSSSCQRLVCQNLASPAWGFRNSRRRENGDDDDDDGDDDNGDDDNGDDDNGAAEYLDSVY